MARVLANAALPPRRPARARLQGRRATATRDAIVTPIVPVLVEDDWKAALLWKALYEAGVYVNVAVHPAVPPGGALLRTSVMATHDAETIERALDIFARQARLRVRARPLPGPTRRRAAGVLTRSTVADRSRRLSNFHKF